MANYQTPATAIDVEEVFSELSEKTQNKIDEAGKYFVRRLREEKRKATGSRKTIEFGEVSARELLMALVRKGYLPR